MPEAAPHVKIFRKVIEMKLDSAEECRKVVERLIKKTHKNDALLIHDEEHYNDWAANMEIMGNLNLIHDLIATEKIFHYAITGMAEVRSRHPDDRQLYMHIVHEGLTKFIDTLLLQTLESSFDELNETEFQTDFGKKFHKDAAKKLDELIKSYQDHYDL